MSGFVKSVKASFSQSEKAFAGSQITNNVCTTSYQRRCNVMTLHRRWFQHCVPDGYVEISCIHCTHTVLIIWNASKCEPLATLSHPRVSDMDSSISGSGRIHCCKQGFQSKNNNRMANSADPDETHRTSCLIRINIAQNLFWSVKPAEGPSPPMYSVVFRLTAPKWSK